MKRATAMAIIDKSLPDISIHALVKRATLKIGGKNYKIVISIHALVKRATDMGYGGSYNRDISIHALVKRATK